MYNVHIVKLEAEIRKICSSKELNKKTKIITIQVGRNWRGQGGTGPPSFLDLYSKNFKISQIQEEIFFSI